MKEETTITLNYWDGEEFFEYVFPYSWLVKNAEVIQGNEYLDCFVW